MWSTIHFLCDDALPGFGESVNQFLAKYSSCMEWEFGAGGVLLYLFLPETMNWIQAANGLFLQLLHHFENRTC